MKDNSLMVHQRDCRDFSFVIPKFTLCENCVKIAWVTVYVLPLQIKFFVTRREDFLIFQRPCSPVRRGGH